MKHLITLENLTKQDIELLLTKAAKIKAKPKQWATAMQNRTLLTIFAKPSLRTHISFHVAMNQMGGSAIYYNISTSPLGKKETISDTATVVSRYVDAVMARLYEHKDIEDLAKHATIPVINGLTNYSHPCQILGDLLTIKEKKGNLKGLKLAYFGDANNNVTHSLMFGCAIMGMHITVGCPNKKEFLPLEKVTKAAQKIAKASGATITITDNTNTAIEDADVVYTDSWMSYHIKEAAMNKRKKLLQEFQVNAQLMKKAKKDAIFMNCLPAARGMEQTADVIDGPQSVVFDQAENRLHIQKAILLWLMGK